MGGTCLVETEHEVMEVGGEDSESDALSQLVSQDPAINVIDPALLEEKVAHWTRMRELLTAYIRQHMQEGYKPDSARMRRRGRC
jgi:hypothetical protein